MSDAVATRVMELLKAEPNVKEFERPDRDQVVFTTKGDPDNYQDPTHNLSTAFTDALISLGIDPHRVFYNDCEGCYNEACIPVDAVESPELIRKRHMMVPVSIAAFDAVKRQLERQGLKVAKDFSIAGGFCDVKEENGRAVAEIKVNVYFSK